MTATIGGAGTTTPAIADETGPVVAVERSPGGIVEISLRLPHLARRCRPGQFAMLRCSEGAVPLLRRPMSVARVRDDVCDFVFEVVGVGTRMLADRRVGEAIAVLGPLGVGFSLPAGMRRIVCVAGGLGCAPFPLLVSRAVAAGVEEVIVLHGAATASRLYPEERFTGGDRRVRVVEVTEDGSRGRRGRVTDVLGDLLDEGCDALYACGPTAMLVAVAAQLRERTSRRPPIAEASLEAPMGCGFGVCLGCAVPVRGTDAQPTWALCCRQGPVLAFDDVDWERLASLRLTEVG